FAGALTRTMNLPFFMIRKAGKLPPPVVEVSYNLEYGSATIAAGTDTLTPARNRVLLLDDVLATAGTTIAGCDLVRALGGVVVGCQFLIEIGALHGRERLMNHTAHPIHSLIVL
ncbi:adenine phosphoribosyltransferase, partial [bacterium]|nr:adenine phosphoribosyltransferase [bacterium]